jgi:hypothetical protein
LLIVAVLYAARRGGGFLGAIKMCETIFILQAIFGREVIDG